MYCESYGLEAPTGFCDTGYYCPAGQNTSTPQQYSCTPGHYCEQGSTDQMACASGTYQDEFTQVNKLTLCRL